MKLPELSKIPEIPKVGNYHGSWILKIFSKDYQKLLNANNAMVEHNEEITEQINQLIEHNAKLVDHNRQLSTLVTQLTGQNKLLQDSLLFRPTSQR